MDVHEQALLQRVQQHDAGGLATLYDLHSKLVYSVAVAILRNPPQAEDVLQEIFLRIWRNPEKYSVAHGDLASWLAVVTRNRCIDLMRQRKRLVSIDDMHLASPLNLAADTEQSLMYTRVQHLIDTLPTPKRTAVNLAFNEQKTHAEIAQMTGIPLGTIKSRIKHGLSAVKKELEIQEA